ncbi:hypothetical protein [Rhizobium sp. MHM7A]|uniref:hypothetical protein n=1 Tax=Rhizobium sp. MHM7A TaxID=2583233 RepID=UPI00110638ED|nr:hypothetical protein [Rhizobium sp. MHM7A]TLX15982.1 hypothetical protein FFR93_01305 [Rhizobium sp. MHM7A]
MEITIQRDGCIAVREHGNDVYFADPDDQLAIFELFRAHTVFEDGLTLRQLMKALRPWKNVLNKAAWMNFDAWLTAADKTHVTDADDSDIDEEIVSVEIYCILDLHRFDNGTLNIDYHWDYHGKFAKPIDLGTGYLTDTCGLTFMSPKKFVNVPIIINSIPSIHDIAVGPPEGKRPILSETSPGAYERIELTPTLFETVILGLLDRLSFHGDPEVAEERGEQIAGMVADIKAREEAKDEVQAEYEEADDQPSETDAVDEAEEGGSLSMTFEEFDAMMGIKRDREREDAVFSLHRVLKAVTMPDEEIADLLGLTLLGLDEIKRGITAHFSTKAIVQMKMTVLTREQRKKIREMHPDLATEENQA